MTLPHDRDTDPALAAVLDTTTHVLLDFDGPVCDVFAGYPAHRIADELRHLLTHDHHLALPDDVLATQDPLHVIQRTADLDPQLWPIVDDAQRAAEVRAVATAEPTPGTSAFLAACQATGRPVAIVSNNSAEAVTTYLELHGLAGFVAHVQGRDRQGPAFMKPNPYPLHQALAVLDAKPSTAVLVGDSLTDLEAGAAGEVRVIAYANKPHKLTDLTDADAVITSMQTLADALS